MLDIELWHDDCMKVLPEIESNSVDAVITDPPYPMIKRAYGKMTVDEWWDMMMIVCKETRRILKPSGSAMFILQPNSEHAGQLRGWLWEFMAWVCREWNMVQDVWWWNIATIPGGGAVTSGLLRGSLKACVWVGDRNCYRRQENVLWEEADSTKARRLAQRTFQIYKHPSGIRKNDTRMNAAVERKGGVTPYNVIPLPRASRWEGGGKSGHGASTPLKLATWWTRYICPLGGTIADWFMGSGTMGVAAIQNGCDFIGIEKFPLEDREINKKNNPDYMSIAVSRLEEALKENYPNEDSSLT